MKTETMPEWTDAPVKPGVYLAQTSKGVWIGKFSLPEHRHLLQGFRLAKTDFFGPLPPVPAKVEQNAKQVFRQKILDEIRELQGRFARELNQLQQRVEDYKGNHNAPF